MAHLHGAQPTDAVGDPRPRQHRDGDAEGRERDGQGRVGGADLEAAGEGGQQPLR